MNYQKAANLARATLSADSTPTSSAQIANCLIDVVLGRLSASIDRATGTLGRLVANYGLKVTGTTTFNGDVVVQQQVLSVSGAISIKSGTVYITKSSVAALTLAAPTAGADDGKRLRVISTTAQAHTVTNSTPGFNNGSTSSDVGTFGAAVGNGFECEAYQGVWYLVGTPKGVTFA
ncbi:hypothetical protein CfE428DRAFT_5533 [Chthoniobacter flavus Ellin428]|uniref:Uncharacterized protein n=1 Tax=Chthoniobacter flavus Ellin428 TaxID=497964 RepID=B4D9E3_9BACT|nr:hypothetical protein [Chthoniobacter flavus]EDY16904.1 hypothetical protein CfE428DRAFT_5533 [Chthoniobacter flavus Ellin428]TCO87786.1 hypothetical protein EV701_12085 [Chthoniobacter flavus]